MKAYVAGDTHGGERNDFSKLNTFLFPEGKELTADDVVIVCGDFGLTFPNLTVRQGKNQQDYWIKWLMSKPWTTCFVDGNHENHDFLLSLPTKEMFGGKVGILKDGKIYHLKRGEIYTIGGKKIFCMGGAKTTDMPGRIEGVSWWRTEIPSSKEMYYAMDNLVANGNKVDFILAHTLPDSMIKLYTYKNDIDIDFDNPGQILIHDEVSKSLHERYIDPTARFMREVCSRVEFDHYYCGHFHDDVTMGKFTILYEKVVQIV